MYSYISNFCDEFKYPDEAKAALTAAYDIISKNSYASELFQRYVRLYNEDRLSEYNEALEALDTVADQSDVHKYTVNLLFFICLSKHARELYERNGINYEIYYDSMSDLKWKLLECNRMYNIWGAFTKWFPRFFALTRFALGRLQFEIKQFKGYYEKGGYSLKDNDYVINVHIPSCGPLLHDECIASYRKASEFFKDYFVGRPTVFVCNSWLLFPPNKEIFPKHSNLLKFIEDFDIYDYSTDKEGSDLWRIFYKDYKKAPADLPRQTSLQRSYADWLLKGNAVGTGKGVFFFDKD